MSTLLPNCYSYTRQVDPIVGRVKVCRDCKSEKDLSLFHRATTASDGYRNVCKACRSSQRSQGIKIPDIIRDGHFFRVCRHCRMEQPLTAYAKRPNGLNGRMRRCRRCINTRARERLSKCPKARTRKRQAMRRFYREHGSAYFAKYQTASYRQRYEQQNPYRRTVRLLRQRMVDAFAHYKHKQKRPSKAARTLDLIGCSVEALIHHLEAQFAPGMTWENHGRWRKHGPRRWHIDHIRPCASFDLTDPEQQRACFHYTNLRPLWAVDNIIKGSKHVT